MSEYHQTVANIEAFLKEHGVSYEKFEHEPVKTSEEAANVRPDFSISQGTKALIIRIKPVRKQVISNGGDRNNELSNGLKKNGDPSSGGRAGKSFAMVVVPGDKKFDGAKVRQATGASDIRFATPEEVAEITGGVVPGGVPPFGNLFGLPVFCDETVFNNERIIFNAGDRSVSITIASEDYKRVVNPNIVAIS